MIMNQLFPFILAGSLSVATATTAKDLNAKSLPLQPATTAPTLLNNVFKPSSGILKFRYGGYIYCEVSGSPVPPTFHLLDKDGRRVSSATLEVPGASDITFHDFDLAPNGSIVFAGAAYSSSGQLSPLLAWIAPGGKTEQIVTTAPYFSTAVTVAPDGTVWTVGFEMINRRTRASGLDPNAGVLRHFDSGGKLLQTFIPQSRFNTRALFAHLQNARIVATADRLAWFTPSADDSGYMEIVLKTMEQHVFPGLPAKPNVNVAMHGTRLLDAVTISEDGVPYMTVSDDTSVYSLDRMASKWAPVQLPTEGNSLGRHHLVGIDGDNVLIRQGMYSKSYFVAR